MAKENLTLKVSKAEYEDKIATLNDYLGKLDNSISKYRQLETKMDSFIGGEDDNFEKLRNHVETNIKAVEKERKLTENAIKTLEEILQDQESFNEQFDRTMDRLGEAAKSKIKSAIDTAISITD